MDIGGLVPVFLSLTKNLSDEEKRIVSLQAIGTALIIGVLFLAVGRLVFRVLGISEYDFEIAGGLLLLVLAILEMLPNASHERPSNPHVGPVPLGTPLIAGPAVLTSMIILSGLRGTAMTLASLCANLILVGAAFHQSKRLSRWIGEDGLRATSQVISLFLAAIAVSMIRRGFQGLHF